MLGTGAVVSGPGVHLEGLAGESERKDRVAPPTSDMKGLAVRAALTYVYPIHKLKYSLEISTVNIVVTQGIKPPPVGGGGGGGGGEGGR